MGILSKIAGKKDKAPSKGVAKAKKADADEKVVVEGAADKAEAKAEPATRGALAREDGGDSHRILVRPMMTEKTSMLAALNQYTFAVAAGATKVDVARAIRDLYGVKPTKVRIANIEGKLVHSGRSQGREKNLKKAIVSLKPGDTISA